MSNQQVYLSNHRRALRFPWSIYHKPLIRSLEEFLSKAPAEFKSVLVIGPGDFQELPLLIERKYEISILDIDPRVIDNLRKIHGSLIKGYYLTDEHFNGYPETKFDMIYAKEVIEHLSSPKNFLLKLKLVLSDKGLIWISTPNYGFFLLPFLENTVLELVARLSGFSRKHIHPSKFGPESLEKLFKEVGLKPHKVEVTFGKLAICITAGMNTHNP